MTNYHPQKFYLSITIIALLSGCTSTPEVRQLAETTAVNSVIVASELRRFASQENQLQQQRIKTVSDLEQVVSNAKKMAMLDRELLKRSGDDATKFLKQLDGLIALAASLRVPASYLADQPKPVIQDFSQQVQALSALAKTMSELAKDNDYETDVKFLTRYVKTVAEDVKLQRKALETETKAVPAPELSVLGTNTKGDES
jgi:hypothetical protein